MVDLWSLAVSFAVAACMFVVLSVFPFAFMVCYFVHWNARSIRPKRFWLRQSFFHHSCCLALQETFLKQQDTFGLSGKVVYRQDRSSLRGGGLVCGVSCRCPSRVIDFRTPPSWVRSSWGVFVA